MMKKFANVILLSGQSVLMQLRDNIPDIAYPNTWSIPGGKVEPEETPEAAAIREFKEETGYILKNPIFFDQFSYDFIPESAIDVFYEFYDGKQKIDCFEGQKMEFIPFERLGSDELFFIGHNNWVNMLLDRLKQKK